MPRIMLVEDDPDLSKLTKAVLVSKGYVVTTYAQGKPAIDDAKRNKPNLIIMDMMLAGMSGAEAVRELKKDPVTAKIPVVFLTGLIEGSEKDVAKQGINVDGTMYPSLGKPFGLDQLFAIIQGAMK